MRYSLTSDPRIEVPRNKNNARLSYIKTMVHNTTFMNKNRKQALHQEPALPWQHRVGGCVMRRAPSI